MQQELPACSYYSTSSSTSNYTISYYYIHIQFSNCSPARAGEEQTKMSANIPRRTGPILDHYYLLILPRTERYPPTLNPNANFNPIRDARRPVPLHSYFFLPLAIARTSLASGSPVRCVHARAPSSFVRWCCKKFSRYRLNRRF